MLHHHYLFFHLDRTLYGLPQKTVLRLKKEFVSIIKREKTCKITPYMLLGLKHEIAFMLLIQSPAPDAMQELVSILLKTRFGRFLSLVTTLFGIVGQSTYVKKHTRQEQALDLSVRLPYLIIYPFTKTKEWYMLPFEERKTMMMEHIRVGHGHAHIRQLLLYAYGIDDHEFIVSYETPSLEDFQRLILDLRASKARLYTANDLPIYTCIHQPVDRMIEIL